MTCARMYYFVIISLAIVVQSLSVLKKPLEVGKLVLITGIHYTVDIRTFSR